LAILATIGLVGFGPFLIKSLYGDAFDIPRSLFACHVVFLILFGWRDVIRSILIGQGFLTNTVKSIVIGVAISLPMALFGLYRFGLEEMFIGLALGIALSPGWQLPRIALRELNRTDNIDSYPVPETNPAPGKVCN
jgi:O-antigen/teichoic acid export membrane protein